MQKIFITGAGGFIGRHLLELLLTRNKELIVLMMPGEPIPPLWGDRVQVVTGDIRELDKYSVQIGKFDTLFHLAAVVSDWGARQEHIDITVNGTKNAIQLALKNKAKFVVTTSIAAFASTLGSGRLDENSPLGKPSSNYEYVKQLQEKVTLEAVKNDNLKAVIIRPANVYGVGSVWVDRFIKKLSNKEPSLIGDGNRDAGLVHVKNLVGGMILAAENRDIRSGEIFLLSDNQDKTWKEYVEILANNLNLPKPKSIPKFIARLAAPILEFFGHIIN
ncbi:MAG: NAD-dependent epimerase/dehydratase family protein, partial [Leptospiraceae bacterium]|nr:NAD-dependent epimerase/dehydratase family protein [Leptospiraceae bacterium]